MSLLDKINALAKKAKTEGLTEEEKQLQQTYRQEFLEQFRQNFRRQLDNIEIRYVEDEMEKQENDRAKQQERDKIEKPLN